MELACEQCGTTFTTPERHRKFCGRACYLDRIACDKVTKVCPVCDESFTVPAVVADRFTVCSIECRRVGTEYPECATCGKVFTGKRGDVRRHCSEECRRPQRLIACDNCGRPFHARPSYTTRRFCSFGCYRRFKGETVPERNVRLILDRLGVVFEQEAKVPGVRGSVDFVIGRVALEVDGAYWHARTADRDAAKDAKVTAAGYAVVRITDDGLYGDVTDGMVALVESAMADHLTADTE